MGTVKVPKEGMERKSSGLVHGHEPQCLCAGSIPFFEHLVEQKWVKPLNLWPRRIRSRQIAPVHPPLSLLWLPWGASASAKGRNSAPGIRGSRRTFKSHPSTPQGVEVGPRHPNSFPHGHCRHALGVNAHQSRK